MDHNRVAVGYNIVEKIRYISIETFDGFWLIMTFHLPHPNLRASLT